MATKPKSEQSNAKEDPTPLECATKALEQARAKASSHHHVRKYIYMPPETLAGYLIHYMAESVLLGKKVSTAVSHALLNEKTENTIPIKLCAIEMLIIEAQSLA